MQTITVPAKTFEKILSKLEQLTEDIQDIKTRLAEEEPPYGSQDWWEWSDKKAKEDIKSGKTVRFNSAEKAIKWLNS